MTHTHTFSLVGPATIVSCAERQSAYDSAHYAEKQHVSDYIVGMVHERGGRFIIGT